MVGTLDGAAVSQRGPITGHAWIQQSAGSTLDVPFEGGGKLHAQWDGLVADGQMFSATGALTLLPSGPHGGETLDYGAAVMKKTAENVDFELTQLSSSAAIDGTLNGCVRWQPF